MAKFHIHPVTGEPGACRAKKGGCPFASDSEHYGSAEEAREAFEKTMSNHAVVSLEKKELQPDIFVSILTSGKDVLSEQFVYDLGKDVEPGEYMASYYDSETDQDKLIVVKISPEGRVDYEKVAEFRTINSPASEKTASAIASLRGELEGLFDKSDPDYCEKQNIDRVTLLEHAQEIRRKIAKFDWTSAEGATQGRASFEDIEWVLDKDLAVAEQYSTPKEVNAIRESKALVSSFLDSTDSRRVDSSR